MPLARIEPDPGVVTQVLTYFVRNRQSADTLEGIARWRLLEEEVRHNVQQTQRALEWLVEQDLVEELRPPGYQTSLFRLNPSRREEAERFLRKQKKRPEE